MRSVCGVVLALLVVFAAAADDLVRLGNEATGQDNGVLAWGSGDMRHAHGPSPVSVGSIVPGNANQVVSFTVGRPPALDARVVWTEHDDAVRVDYPPLYEVPIQLWILCATDDCSEAVPDWKRANLAGFLIWANERLAAEHTGLQLVPGASWITDHTGSTGRVARLLEDFKTSRCDKLAELTADMRTPGAFNVYMVRTVDGGEYTGDSCGTDDSAVVGHRSLWGTMLHEMGHDLSLEHTDDQTWYLAVGGKKNVMCSESTSRRYLTEGQVFRMHFQTRTGLLGDLVQSLPLNLPLNRVPRDCANVPPPGLPCPPQEFVLWTDP